MNMPFDPFAECLYSNDMKELKTDITKRVAAQEPVPAKEPTKAVEVIKEDINDVNMMAIDLDKSLLEVPQMLKNIMSSPKLVPNTSFSAEHIMALKKYLQGTIYYLELFRDGNKEQR